MEKRKLLNRTAGLAVALTLALTQLPQFSVSSAYARVSVIYHNKSDDNYCGHEVRVH